MFYNRLGTDITIQWPITVEGVEDISTLDLTLYILCNRFKKEMDFSIEDNTPTWQLTGLDFSPYKRVKIYTKAAQKSGATASASTTPSFVLEMILDDHARGPYANGAFIGSTVIQKINDENRLATLTCVISSDKTSFSVYRMTNLYGTAATGNSDVGGYVFLIEGYYD